MSNHSSITLRRRDLFQFFGAAALLDRKGAAAGSSLSFTALDHVGITVSDAQKSAAFYARVFGATVYKDKQSERRYLKLGPGYLSIQQAAAASRDYRVDHISPGVKGFVDADVEQYLKGHAVAFRKTESGPFVTDPDGIDVQLSPGNSWNRAIRSASPESYPASGEPVFHPTGLDHLLLDVKDPEASAGFYERIFGPVSQRNNNRTWFQTGDSRIGLLAAAGGRRPGVNHFCVSATAFEHEAVIRKLEYTGARPGKPEVAGAPEFRDPDGILVQVMGPRVAAGKK